MLVWFPVQEAEVLAYKDKLRLLKTQKLTLVVDLDQTLIHTSTDPHIEPGLPVSIIIYTHTYPSQGVFVPCVLPFEIFF